MKKIVAISGIFAILLSFTACEKQQISPVSDDDTFMYSIDGDGTPQTRGGETEEPTTTSGPTPTSDNDDITDPVIDGDGGIVDPDEDEDYDNDDEDNG